MAGGISFIHWGGVVSCVFGGALYLIAVVKGRRASELSTAIKLDRLSGAPPALQAAVCHALAQESGRPGGMYASSTRRTPGIRQGLDVPLAGVQICGTWYTLCPCWWL